MNRHAVAIMGMVIGAVWSTSASAIWVDDCAHQIRAGHQHNVQWPWPFVCPDRAAVRSPFDVMIANGWRRQNLLGGHHFNSDTGELTTAGQLKVQWIMTQAPEQYRQVFIERSLDPSETEQRTVAAQEYAQKVAMGEARIDIQDTHLLSEGRPAATVDMLNVRFIDSMPPPVLPSPGAASSLGSGD